LRTRATEHGNKTLITSSSEQGQVIVEGGNVGGIGNNILSTMDDFLVKDDAASCRRQEKMLFAAMQLCSISSTPTPQVSPFQVQHRNKTGRSKRQNQKIGSPVFCIWTLTTQQKHGMTPKTTVQALPTKLVTYSSSFDLI
jgi:hypothetical protein